MKLFYIFFLVLFLSSYSGGNDNNTDVVDSNFFNVDNIQAVIKERARHEDTVYEKIHSYLTSIDLAEDAERVNKIEFSVLKKVNSQNFGPFNGGHNWL
jgi:hypothetical protein